jgi:monovalent cation:H+ antiporter-2, CPA2 family
LKEELERAHRRQAEKAAAGKTFTPEELVDRFPLFAGLTPEQREVLVLHFGTRTAEPGERIIRAGDKADSVYFICQGQVEVTVAGRRIKLGPGDFFGEMALISGLPCSADVTALDYCKLATLSRRDFRRFLSRYLKSAIRSPPSPLRADVLWVSTGFFAGVIDMAVVL